MLTRRFRLPHARRRAQRGLSIVELMVGIAIGLIVTAGALALMANYSVESRRVLLETRLNQDLRAAADVVTRDLRRGGYWAQSTAGMWVNGGPNVPPQNPYTRFYQSECNAAPLGASAPSPAASASVVCYAVAQDNDNAVAANEMFGFHLGNDGVLYAVVSGSAQQALTDPNTIRITNFVVTPISQVVDMTGYCKKTCTVNCPRLVLREFQLVLSGQIPGDASIQRSLRSDVRVRNDFYDGQCPA